MRRSTRPLLLVLAAVVSALGRHVVDDDARAGDVVLLVVSKKRERVPTVRDVLGALPVQRSKEAGGENVAVVVADQFAVPLEPDPEDALRTARVHADWQGTAVGEVIGR